MTDLSDIPEHNVLQAKTEHSACRGSQIAPVTGSTAPENLALPQRPCPWPFKPQDTQPLAWWRMLPADEIGNPERLLLLAALEQIRMLHCGDDGAAALKGDPAAAIGFAFSLMPIEQMTLTVDIAMTALMRCALERNSAAALVLAQILGLTNLGHPNVTEIAASWLDFGRRNSADPRKVSEAETLLRAAFRERDQTGNGT
jgi:hypothetical protein